MSYYKTIFLYIIIWYQDRSFSEYQFVSVQCLKKSGISIVAYTLTKKSLATLDGDIVDPEITAKLEMQDVLKVHDTQT